MQFAPSLANSQTELPQFQALCLTDVPALSLRVYYRHLLLLLAVGVFAVFIYNGHRALYDTSEARYAETAREMVSSGEWLVPRLFHQPHMTKPPLSYWLIAVPIKIFGTAEWAARLSAGIFFLLTVVLTAEIARAMWQSPFAGIVAGWLQLTGIFPFGAAHVVTSDVFLTAFETGGMLCAWKCLHARSGLRGWQMACGAAWGAAFLTKGPPGLLPWTAIVATALLTRRRLQWRNLYSPWTIAAFVLVAIPWYVTVLGRVPDVVQTWKREAVLKALEMPDRHIARWEYLGILVAGSLPGSAALMIAAVRAVRKRRLWRGGAVSIEAMFLSAWVVVPLIVFIVVRQRLYLYVLPLFPPIAIASAKLLADWWCGGEIKRHHIPRWAVGVAVGCLAAGITGRFVYAQKPNPLRNFKPLANAISADAQTRKAKPSLLIFSRNQGLGLAYYLGDVPTRRTGSKYLQEPEHRKGSGKRAQLNRALEEPVRPGNVEYLVIKEGDYRTHADSIAKHSFGEPVRISPWIALPRLPEDTMTTISQDRP